MHDNLMIHEDAVLRWYKEFFKDYKQVTTPTLPELLILVAWIPPGASLFKVNTYATLDLRWKHFGLGASGQDETGRLIASVLVQITSTTAIDVAEA